MGNHRRLTGAMARRARLASAIPGGELGDVLMILTVASGLVCAASPPPVIRVVTPGPGWLGILLPYLLGAATALVVQLVVQLVVVPRVETRKRREDRWERNVLELAELLSTDLADRASAAHVAQMVSRDLRDMAAHPEADVATVARIQQRLPEQLAEARRATSAFRDIAHTRVGLLTHQIERLSPGAVELGEFAGISRTYWLRVARAGLWHEGENAPVTTLKERWDQEYEARADLISQVTLLADLRRPPQVPLRRRFVFWKR